MNRRDFLKFLGGTAAAAAVAPQALAEAFDAPRAYPVIWHSPDFSPVAAQNPGFIILEPGMSVQEAIDALPAAGGTVYVRSGSYIVNEAITFPEGVQMVAEGSITISDCMITGKTRPQDEAPLVFLMEEDDQVVITNNIFQCEGGSMFTTPIGEHLAALKEKMRRLCLKAKQLII